MPIWTKSRSRSVEQVYSTLDILLEGPESDGADKRLGAERAGSMCRASPRLPFASDCVMQWKRLTPYNIVAIGLMLSSSWSVALPNTAD